MALLDNYQSKLDITYGSEDDICLYCAKEFFSNPRLKSRDCGVSHSSITE